MKYTTLLIVVMLNFSFANGNEKDTTENKQKSPSDKEIVYEKVTPIIQKIELTLPQSTVNKIEAKLETKEKEFLDKYGAILIAFIALIGSFITTIIGNRNAKLNLSKQLSVSESNLKMQIKANKELEHEKKLIETKQEKLNDLKEMVARFIKHATLLNFKFNEMIYYFIGEGRTDEANELYTQTNQLRNELKGVYYSIKVTLDGSEKQLDLEKTIDNYMNVVDFNVDLKKIEADMYEQPIGQLYHKIKAIIHDNYAEPK
jgi:hypothetical protein